MTCRYSETDWRDVLYNAVRKAPGGLPAAAAFLTTRRDRTIHPETLRQRLRGVDGDCISMDMAELLTEWLQDMGRKDARDWIHALNGRWSIASTEIDPPPAGGWTDEVNAIREKLLNLSVHGGKLTELGLRATGDGQIDPAEADALEAQALDEIRVLFRLIRNTRRAAGTDGAA